MFSSAGQQATKDAKLIGMALFQKNPHVDRQHQQLFTVGANRTVLIVGLGNIGKEYEDTRHNIGFKCLDVFATTHEFGEWTEKRDLDCVLNMKIIGDIRVILIKPTTMMNLSGEAAQKVAHFYKIHHEQIAAVHDELAIPFGQIRMRVGGSDAGNNGVKSIIQHIGEDFARLRVGIGDKQSQGKMDNSDFVLAKFSDKELSNMPALTREVTSILTEYIFSGDLPHDTRSFLT